MKTIFKIHVGCYFYVLLILGVVYSNETLGQTPILQRPVYLELKNIRTDKALEIISKQCNFNFTYNTSLFRGDSLINVNSQGGTVKQVLDKIFKNGFEYKSKGSNLVISRPALRQKDIKPGKKSASNYIIHGSITNRITGEDIAYASVYDTASLASAVTNIKGFFQLVIESKTPANKLAIAISRKDFIDTLIFVEPANANSLAVMLLPQIPVIEKIIEKDTIKDTLILEVIKPLAKEKKEFPDEKWLEWLAGFKQRIAAINISENKDHYAQLSMVPAIGTDGTASTLYTYHLSLNMFGGYTGAINGLEAASVFNLNKGNVKGAQFAGAFNATGGDLNGIQAAAIANRTYGKIVGIQSGGLINMSFDSVSGAQLSGFMNLNTSTLHGLQAAGFMNLQKGKLKGGQLAGFMNLTADSLNGIQMAGFMNVTRLSCRGIQAAGFLNFSKNVNTQIAGFINLADTVNGLQAAGFLNGARVFNGVHVGIINTADTCSGIPIGLFSFIKKGLHQIELSANEVAYANLGFRTGVKKLYTMISVGAQPIHDQYKFIYGFGIGHAFELNPKSNINLELFATQVHLGNWNQFNNIYSLRLGFERFIVPKVSFFAGASANINLFDTKEETRKPYANLAYDGPKLFTENYGNGYEMNAWIGFNAGIRFL